MAKQVYKVPVGVTRDDLLPLIGDEGTILNPIEDANGNLIISIEEWTSQEFASYKDQYPDYVIQFELINYEPKLLDTTGII